jgi:hypothetical protein
MASDPYELSRPITVSTSGVQHDHGALRKPHLTLEQGSIIVLMRPLLGATVIATLEFHELPFCHLTSHRHIATSSTTRGHGWLQ